MSDMAAGTSNITVEQGADFYATLELEDSSGNPVDLTGVTGSGQIRSIYSASAVLASITVSIVGAPSLGVLAISMAASITSAIPVPDAEDSSRPLVDYIYDIEVDDGSGGKHRIIQGKARISPEVTR